MSYAFCFRPSFGERGLVLMLGLDGQHWGLYLASYQGSMFGMHEKRRGREANKRWCFFDWRAGLLCCVAVIMKGASHSVAFKGTGHREEGYMPMQQTNGLKVNFS